MPVLLNPITLGSTTITNRLVMPPMAMRRADADGGISDQIIAHYAEKTIGGYMGLVIVEHSYVHPLGKRSAGQISAAEDSMIAGLRKLADVIHAHGPKVVLQLNHAGSATKPNVIGTTPVGPSEIRHPRKNILPRKLSEAEIDDVVMAFQDASRRAQKAGFDGVELHSAHGYLLNQFYSPITNKRTDRYGGNVSNRVLIHKNIIKAIRAALGEEQLISVRLGASDFIDGGITIEDSLVAAGELEKAGADMLDISAGFSGFKVEGLAGQGYFAPLSEAIKKVVSVPVMLTGGITEIKHAERLLSENKADLIGVGRAILKDSGWAKRAIESVSKTES